MKNLLSNINEDKFSDTIIHEIEKGSELLFTLEDFKIAVLSLHEDVFSLIHFPSIRREEIEAYRLLIIEYACTLINELHSLIPKSALESLLHLFPLAFSHEANEILPAQTDIDLLKPPLSSIHKLQAEINSRCVLIPKSFALQFSLSNGIKHNYTNTKELQSIIDEVSQSINRFICGEDDKLAQAGIAICLALLSSRSILPAILNQICAKVIGLRFVVQNNLHRYCLFWVEKLKHQEESSYLQELQNACLFAYLSGSLSEWSHDPLMPDSSTMDIISGGIGSVFTEEIITTKQQHHKDEDKEECRNNGTLLLYCLVAAFFFSSKPSCAIPALFIDAAIAGCIVALNMDEQEVLTPSGVLFSSLSSHFPPNIQYKARSIFQSSYISNKHSSSSSKNLFLTPSRRKEEEDHDQRQQQQSMLPQSDDPITFTARIALFYRPSLKDRFLSQVIFYHNPVLVYPQLALEAHRICIMQRRIAPLSGAQVRVAKRRVIIPTVSGYDDTEKRDDLSTVSVRILPVKDRHHHQKTQNPFGLSSSKTHSFSRLQSSSSSLFDNPHNLSSSNDFISNKHKHKRHSSSTRPSATSKPSVIPSSSCPSSSCPSS
ncbi:hypothetical protein ADUPG1_012825, partial [Aduncisulcus paluster]